MKKSKGKDKKTPAQKASKKQESKGEKVLEKSDELDHRVSLVERVRSEKAELEQKFGRIGDGAKREIARMTFALWLTIPVRYRGAPEAVIGALGISDPDILELIQIKRAQDFGEIFNVGHGALAAWRKELVENDELDHRSFFKGLMNEGLAALYRKLLEQGDAERFKAFAGYVEGWMPGLALQHSGQIDTLDDEERAVLDRLLEKNSKTVVT